MCVALLAPDTGSVDRKDVALDKLVVVVPDRIVRTLYDPPRSRGSQSTAIQESTRMVKKWTGRNDSRLGPEETKSVKDKDPEGYKRYLKVRKDVVSAYQDFSRSAARKAGKPVLIRSVIADMAKAGISYHPYGGIETLYVGENGKLYTPPPHREILASVAPGSKIVMNPRYDPRTDDGAVFKYLVPGSKRDEDSMSSAYTRTFITGKKNKRFGLVADTIRDIPRLRPRWVRDLKSRDRRTRTLAAITELMYSLAARPGGTGNNVDGTPTYGLTTLLCNHVNVRNNTVTMRYLGKDAIQQTHVIRAADPAFPENAQVVRVIQECTRGKRGTEYLWTDARGERIDKREVAAYMRGKQVKVSPHKFRHVRGTVLMQQLLDGMKVGKDDTQPQVEKLVKTAAIKVGELLGHVSGDKPTAATSLKNYISPGILVDFFTKRGLRVPQWVPRAGRGEDAE